MNNQLPFGFVPNMQTGMQGEFYSNMGFPNFNNQSNGYSNLESRVSTLEQRVKNLDNRLDMVEKSVMGASSSTSSTNYSSYQSNMHMM